MPHDRTYFVYILASRPYGTLYIGVSNDLFRRMFEHLEKKGGAFTAKYNVTMLVWYETHDDIEDAIQREKSLKRWPREWKTNLIEHDNPHWIDLFQEMLVAEKKRQAVVAGKPDDPEHKDEDDKT